MGEKIKILVDPDLQDFMPKYLQNRQSDLQKLRDFLGRSDFDAIRTVSHKIRGHATSYGMAPLSEICKKMEIAAKDGKSDELNGLITEFAKYLALVELP